MKLQLVIGNRNYSSWSLRAWLYLRQSQLPFEEIRLPLFTPEWPEEIANYSPAGRVPVLIDGDITVWDTMAIFEHIHEQYPQAVGWPADVAMRAEARSIAAEMHAGFMAIRDELPQNIRARRKRERSELSDAAQAQIARVCTIWESCRNRFDAQGPWLFGEFSIADVMYAPVALRFVTYEITLAGRASEFVQAVTELPAIQEWMKLSAQESERLDFIDELVPASQGPLVLG